MKKKREILQSNDLLKQNSLLQKSNKLIRKLSRNQTTNRSGISLISLVVMIVVLMILAGITISLVFGQKESISNDVIGQETEKWDGTSNERVNAVQSADGITVPVPKGYVASSVASENTVKDGFVIYEGTDVNIETAQTTRNQFVWVPVANVHDMYGIDKDGKKWGKLYDFSSSGITQKNWTEQNGVMTIADVELYREPDVLTTFDLSNGVTLTQLETEFNAMIESVTTYGGFYIGRYETGNLSQAEAVVMKNNTDIGNQTWYTQYNKLKGIAANSNVTTSMIWGCQWDAVMRWMYNSGDVAKKQYTYDSMGKGNYHGTNENEVIPTGSNSAYAVNNIYDMAGNVYDWTIEAIDTFHRVSRGGNYDDGASTSPAARRDGYLYPTSSYRYYGSRVTLYIN